MNLLQRSLIVFAALLSCGVAYFFWSHDHALPRIQGFVYPAPKIIKPFHLTDHTGAPFTNNSLHGRWSLVFFGYTHCPDVCPATLSVVSQARNLLRAQGLDRDSQYVFVSVDPTRDPVERLAEYVRFFDQKFTAATGEDDVLLRFTGDVGAPYHLPESRDRGNYTVTHSSNIYLFDPGGRLYAVFNSPHKASAMVRDISALRKFWKTNKKT